MLCTPTLCATSQVQERQVTFPAGLEARAPEGGGGAEANFMFASERLAEQSASMVVVQLCGCISAVL